MLVIPAVDILGGRCVRLRQGQFDQVAVYGDDPVAVAQAFRAAGANRIHVVDLDAARGSGDNVVIMERLAREVDCELEVSGGMRDEVTISRGLDAGADFVTIGTLAVSEPDLVARLAERWPGKFYVSLDARQGKLATDGWKRNPGLAVESLADRFARVPIAGFVYTDIARDGMLLGPDFDGLGRLLRRSAHAVILSGGVTTVDDVLNADRLGAAGVIIGTALYEGRLDLKQALAAV